MYRDRYNTAIFTATFNAAQWRSNRIFIELKKLK